MLLLFLIKLCGFLFPKFLSARMDQTIDLLNFILKLVWQYNRKNSIALYVQEKLVLTRAQGTTHKYAVG